MFRRSAAADGTTLKSAYCMPAPAMFDLRQHRPGFSNGGVYLVGPSTERLDFRACCPTPSSRSLPRGKVTLTQAPQLRATGRRVVGGLKIRPRGLQACARGLMSSGPKLNTRPRILIPASRGNAEPTNNSASRTSTLRVRNVACCNNLARDDTSQASQK